MIKKYSVLLLLIILSGCRTKINNENLQGTWVITNYESDKPNSSLLEIKKTDELLNKYTFKEDGILEIKSNRTGNITNTNWDLKSEINQLILSNNPKEFIVLNFTNEKMILMQDFRTIGRFTITLEKDK